jgi:hypothetical protein
MPWPVVSLSSKQTEPYVLGRPLQGTRPLRHDDIMHAANAPMTTAALTDRLLVLELCENGYRELGSSRTVRQIVP